MDDDEIKQLAKELAQHMKPQLPEITVQAFADMYLERYAIPHKRSSKKDDARFKNYILPAFGDRLMGELTKVELTKFHVDIGKKYPYQANRTLEQISRMFTLAQEWGYYPTDKRTPAFKIEPFPEYSRDRFLKPEELERLAPHINAVNHIEYKCLFWCLILTALRSCELLRADWNDLDTNSWELRVKPINSKSGKPHYLPLSAEAMAQLAKLPKRGNLIFAYPSGGAINYQNARRCWLGVVAKSGVQDIHLHDLRRTAASWMVQSGESLAIIGKMLNHSSSASTAVYARFARSDLRVALDQHAKVIGGYIG